MEKIKVDVVINLFILLVLSVVAGCGSSSMSSNEGSVASNTGAITAQLEWYNSQNIKDAHMLAAPTGVATIRLIVSAPDMASVYMDVAASAGQGTVENIPAGSNRTVMAEGLDSNGDVIYRGSVGNINVQAGETTNAGTITLQAVSYTISGTVTLNGSGLSGVTVNLSGPITTSTTTDASGNYSFSVIGGNNFSNGNDPYTVTPTMTGYNFSFSGYQTISSAYIDNGGSVSVAVINANETGVNFAATPAH